MDSLNEIRSEIKKRNDGLVAKEIKTQENIRKRLNEIFGNWNTIDKTMIEKINEHILVEEIPLCIRIGQKPLLIGNFNFKTENEFFAKWARVLALMGVEKMGIELLSDGVELYSLIHDNKKFRKELIKLLSGMLLKQQAYFRNMQTGERQLYRWTNMSKRYFFDNINSSQILQICKLIYIYNFDAVKKNLAILGQSMGLGSTTGTYIYSWLKNMAGLTGKFLASQAPSIDSVFNDTTLEKTHPLKKGKEAPSENSK